MPKIETMFIEFCGTPESDLKYSRRWCGAEKFNPLDAGCEVIEFVNKEKYDYVIERLAKMTDILFEKYNEIEKLERRLENAGS